MLSSSRSAPSRADSSIQAPGTPADRLTILSLLLVCALFAWMRWAKLDELLWGDPVHWLHEVSRVSSGELPYRDFSFQYPPFTAFFFGWTMRALGGTFRTASLLVNFWSFALVLLAYALTRFLLPPSLRFPVCFLMICVGATSLTSFNLFSYRIYTPALETGAAGTLLLLVAMLRILRRGESTPADTALIAAGSTIALLSKPEFAVASICALLTFAFLNGKSTRSNVALLAFSIAPALVLYTALSYFAGWNNLLAGISGYGLAGFACPWWPTGIGVFGVAAALAEAALIAAVLSVPWRLQFASRFGVTYRRMMLLAIPGALIFGAYIATLNRAALTSSLPWIRKAKLVLPSLLWTAPVLMPVMWTVIVLFLLLLVKAVRTRGRLSPSETERLLVFIIPVSMSPRSWFGSTQASTADVAAACYPFLLILGPYLLWRFLSSVPKVPAVRVVAAICILYGTARIAAGTDLLSDRNYRRLETAAGSVKISDYFPGIELYRYVAEHTRPGDYVLELPYGGGLNFASGRPNPIFDTMLFNMEIPRTYQRQDVERFEQRKPALIVAADSPTFGTNFSYGIPGNRACVCPRLVWAPDRPSWDPNYVYPLVDSIARHYRPVLKIGGKVILEPLH